MMSGAHDQVCPNCGASNLAGLQYCSRCAKPLLFSSSPLALEQSGDDGSLVPLWPGSLLRRRYRILNVLGSGGSGSVYEACDLLHRRRSVAIKEIVAFHLGPGLTAEMLTSFYREASLLSALKHPSLPKVYEYFIEQGCCYLVMEHIRGETLEELIGRQPGGRLPLAEALRIAIQLCEVLDYLHSRRIPVIFRDLKPANIIVQSGSGRIYLVDFGLARLLQPSQGKERISLGSPGYAAPEHYDPAQSSPRLDIYSLGATLHRMLTGADPSAAPYSFSSIRSFDPSLPLELDELIACMVAPVPAGRPAGVREVRRRLEELRRRLPGAGRGCCGRSRKGRSSLVR
jgi:serine/threonine protein kinase